MNPLEVGDGVAVGFEVLPGVGVVVGVGEGLILVDTPGAGVIDGVPLSDNMKNHAAMVITITTAIIMIFLVFMGEIIQKKRSPSTSPLMFFNNKNSQGRGQRILPPAAT